MEFLATIGEWLGNWGLELESIDTEQLGLIAWWGSGLAMLSLLGVLVFVPMVVARLPADYFLKERSKVYRSVSPLWAPIYWVGRVIKNLLGALLLVLGVILLFLPGQGLLTIIIGLVLMEFPGKHRLESKIAQRPRILATLNWMRNRSGRSPFASEQRQSSND